MGIGNYQCIVRTIGPSKILECGIFRNQTGLVIGIQGDGRIVLGGKDTRFQSGSAGKNGNFNSEQDEMVVPGLRS